jgi:hypothetical protein
MAGEIVLTLSVPSGIRTFTIASPSAICSSTGRRSSKEPRSAREGPRVGARRSEGVEFRVEYHRQALGDRLTKLART